MTSTLRLLDTRVMATTAPASPMNLWPHLAGRPLPSGEQAEAAEAAARLAAFLPPHLIAHLLGGPGHRADLQRARLLSRYLRAAYRDILEALQQAGIATVAFKGYASAFTLYPDPDLRIAGDLDILVAHDDLPRALAVLADQGLQPASSDTGVWGFLPQASYVPIVGRDGLVNVDLHLEADEYPLSLGLPAADLFRTSGWNADARTHLPRPEDAALILISHAARDHFGPYAVKKLLDLTRLLPQGPCPADWAQVWTTAEASRLRKPLVAALALLASLDVDVRPLPEALEQSVARRTRQPRLVRLARRWRELFPEQDAGVWMKLGDELLLASEPRVALYRQLRRLSGLLWPGSGQPPEAKETTGRA